MIYIPTASRADLEIVILEETELYQQFDEAKLLAGDYTDDELRSTISEWIESGDECAAA